MADNPTTHPAKARPAPVFDEKRLSAEAFMRSSLDLFLNPPEPKKPQPNELPR